MKKIHIDIETTSGYDIGNCGVYKYVESPDFSIQLIGYAVDDGPVQVLDLTNGADVSFIIRALIGPDFLKFAFNAEFEIVCLSKYFGIDMDLRTWRDVQVQAAYYGAIGSLETVGELLGVPEDKAKSKTGRALIKLFSKPDKLGKWTEPQDKPDKWALYKEYNAQDVEAERFISDSLPDAPDMIWSEWREHMDMSKRGVALDLELINNAIEISSKETEALFDEARLMYGLDNPGSPKQIKDFLKSQGIAMDSIAKDALDEALQRSDLTDDARRVLEIRKSTSKSSVAKYAKATEAVCSDGRARGLLRFYGAKTGRFSGKLIQVQNLPRISMAHDDLDTARMLTKQGDAVSLSILYENVNDALSQLCRTMFIPEAGKKFIDADFSSIEARVLAWLADEDWELEVFRTHGKIYEAQAAQMFNVPLESIKKGNPEYSLRAKGKVAVLALGYQGAAGALINMGALNMGIAESELPDIVSKWRKTNRKIVKFWSDLERAAKSCTRINKKISLGKIAVESRNIKAQRFLIISLPSGRRLFYLNPRIKNDKIEYTGTSQTTGRCVTVETYGGKLTENVVQAIARDCLTYKLTQLKKAGYNVVFHIHDEVVIESEEIYTLESVVNIMKSPIPWADGLPLNADGWTGYYFTKD